MNSDTEDEDQLYDSNTTLLANSEDIVNNNSNMSESQMSMVTIDPSYSQETTNTASLYSPQQMSINTSLSQDTTSTSRFLSPPIQQAETLNSTVTLSNSTHEKQQTSSLTSLSNISSPSDSRSNILTQESQTNETCSSSNDIPLFLVSSKNNHGLTGKERTKAQCEWISKFNHKDAVLSEDRKQIESIGGLEFWYYA